MVKTFFVNPPAEFQFLYGTIKGGLKKKKHYWKIGFQFLYGTIKGKLLF